MNATTIIIIMMMAVCSGQLAFTGVEVGYENVKMSGLTLQSKPAFNVLCVCVTVV